ncbi:hypothetical protein BN7_4236 [Wickerhamomyces ciferrii]|uniref:RRM domain-containing protein n=1 Tax=Wickerhamomyces ciferrii (strain ATCC 14091 / BCRC 22168 / CBS 111 / JCM 3599 / NBRC 0793 / NRRL Y-1031 F-60-10) TaxID=1206466 RepID=K0KRJ4_WICCF|nr:uncharacterized protein BN7_4236 [Wickerhamomyces ciferrii]CCH44667.1 hypothetical protein BN7_4236 [Wickerhamomyces ciferrii]
MATKLSILASNIPESVTKDKIHEFFSFCGKIDRIENYDLSAQNNEVVYQVFFANESAVSTALLLNGAELGGSQVKVLPFNDGRNPTANDPPAYNEPLANKQSQLGTVKPPSEEAKSLIDQPGVNSDDIEQESKPKSTIFAEYLSHGYILGDQLIEKAVEHDKQNGYTDKFKKFLKDLDDKYHVQETQQTIDQKYKISANLSRYFEKALNTGVGNKIHGFYSNVVNDSTEIHNEARRLADLKKKEALPQHE